MTVTIGEKIKAKREKKGLTRRDVAHTLGVTEGTVYKWEKYSMKPGGKNLVALCKVIGTKPGFLFQKVKPCSTTTKKKS